MWYKVGRADADAPCDGAVVKSFPYYHVRTCKSFEEFDRRFGDQEGSWLSKGTEHSITADGHISRREGNEKCWAVKITTLKQLQEFVDKYGSIVVGSDSITIYDDYLE